MTMPHLENCVHSDDGWCLDCVKKLHDEGEAKYRDYLGLLPVAYAAEEWASGNITAADFAMVAANGFNGESNGMKLMSRLGWLESEWNRLCKFGDEGADTLGVLLSHIGRFETTADPGPGREVEDVSVRLWCDGSGELLVKTSAATAEPGIERMLNRVFHTETRHEFKSIEGLYSILKDMDAIKSSHPECSE